MTVTSTRLGFQKTQFKDSGDCNVFCIVFVYPHKMCLKICESFKMCAAFLWHLCVQTFIIVQCFPLLQQYLKLGSILCLKNLMMRIRFRILQQRGMSISVASSFEVNKDCCICSFLHSKDSCIFIVWLISIFQSLHSNHYPEFVFVL